MQTSIKETKEYLLISNTIDYKQIKLPDIERDIM